MPRCSKPRYTRTYKDWDDLPINLDVAMVCNVLHLDERTVQRRLTDGTIKGTKLGGRKWIIPKEPLRRLCEGEAEA